MNMNTFKVLNQFCNSISWLSLESNCKTISADSARHTSVPSFLLVIGYDMGISTQL